MATTKVNSEFIADNAISGTIIADGAITSTHLAANCVDSSELVTGSIDTIHIAANQVTATKIVTNGVLTRHISDDQVTADKIASATIVGGNIANNAILTQHIDDDQVTGDQLADALTVVTSVTTPLVDAAIVDGENFKINGGQGSDGQVLTSTGSGVAWEDASGGSVSAVANGANNRIATFSSADALNGESNFTFDGDNVGVGGSTFGTTSNRRVLSVNGTNSATLNIGTGGSQRGYLFTDGSSATVSTVGAIPLKFGVNDSVKMNIDTSGHFVPSANNVRDLGTTSTRWRNIYTNDLQLSNEQGDANEVDGTTGSWTIQEGDSDLFLINRKSGKKYKFDITEIED